jgi:hypothetical protein
MKKDTTAKLADVEARMRRWHTRLTRASNMLQKLDRQRRRLQLQQQVGVGRPQPKMENFAKAAETRFNNDLKRGTKQTAEMPPIPPFLQRSDEPQLVDRLKAKRTAQVEADKHKMPLTGKAALEAVRPKRKKA